MKSLKKIKKNTKAIDLIVHTKSPEKWILLDRETGETYQGNVGGYWDRLDAKFKNK